MAKKKPAKTTRTLTQRFTALERLIRTGFHQTNARSLRVERRVGLIQIDIRNVRKEMNERFAVMEDRIDRLATHVDGFMKLHETLDIEVRVMREQMKRIEERLERVEAAQAS